MKRSPPASPRKRPAQARSRETVAAILEAAARVFEARGYAAGTTNRIAARAGVSIGSLYEYFPNKDAIVVALTERELESERAEITRLLEATRGEALAVVLRRFVAGVVGFHLRRPGLHRMLFDEAEHPPEAHACVLRFEESLAHSLAAILQRRRRSLPDADVAAHLIVQTTESLAHRFALRGIHELDRDAFVEELTRLVARYVGASGGRRRRVA